MAVDEKIVERVARLARIELQPAEVTPFVEELSRILGWIDQLQAVNTDDAEPMSAVIPNQRQWRADEVTDGDRQDEILTNAPDARHGFFAVPKVIE